MMDQAIEKAKPGLRDYWQIFLRRKWLIILPAVAIVSIAIPGSFLLPPVYEASTTLISQEVERGPILQGIANIPVPRGEELNTVSYKILSRRFMKDVADKVRIAGYLRDEGKPSDMDDVLRYLRDITKLRARGSKIMEITVRHPRPDMAKNIADTIAGSYIDKTLYGRQEATNASSIFINQELELQRRNLKDSEESLLAAQEKGILDSLSDEDNILVNGLAKFRTDLVEVEMDLQEANIELQDARKAATSGASEERLRVFYSNPEVAALQARLAILRAQDAELSMKYTAQYPQLVKLRGEIPVVEKELEQAKAKFSTNQEDATARIQYWEDRVRSLTIRRTMLDEKIEDYDRKMQQLPQKQLEFARLRREKAAAENTYSMLLSRLNESKLLESSELRNMGRIAEVLDEAVLPNEPVKPNKKKIAVLALGMGMMIGCGSAFMLEYFDRSFRSVDEVAGFLGLPVLAAVPRLTTHESEVRDKRRKRIVIPCAALVSLLVLLLATDIASAQFMVRDSFFMGIARRVLILLRSKM